MTPARGQAEAGVGGPAGGARRRGRLVGIVFLLMALTAALLTWAWVGWLPGALTRHFEARTGVKIEVRALAVNPFRATLKVNGLLLRNPEGWPVQEFAQAPTVVLDADLWSLWGDRWVIDYAQVVLERFTVVTDEEGVTNLQHLKNRWIASRPQRSEGTPRHSFLVRRLELRFDRLTLADHSKARPVRRELELGVDRTFTDVTDLRPIISDLKPSLATVVVAILPGEIARTVTDVLRPAAGLIKETGQQAAGSVKGLLEKLEETPKP